MVSLTRIETLGYDPAFFKLPEIEDNGKEFSYYLFDTTGPPGWEINWDLVGLHQRSEDPLLLDVRIMDIGDDELSLDAFDPRYADPFLSMNFTEVLMLIQFFEERLADRQRLEATRSPAYFHLLDTEELTRLRLPLWEIERKIGDYYRYTPGENVQSSEKMSLVHLSRWPSDYGVSASLVVVTFDRALLVDPRFSPFDTVTVEWRGMMTFDQGALEEFILLLKQYTDERFSSGSQSSLQP